MTHASLFSGIGGPEVAAAMMGWDNVFHCEINPFGRSILDYWFPESESYEDITKTDFTKHRGQIDVLTGGFPCQPFSYAGKRGGQEDDRYLWPEMLRVIDQIRPTWVVGENVAGITTMVESGEVIDMGGETSLFEEDNGIHRFRSDHIFTIERICRDLESKGYTIQPMLIPACAVGASHRRDRVFIIAHNTDSRDDLRKPGEHESEGREKRISEWNAIRKFGKSGDVRPKVYRFCKGKGVKKLLPENRWKKFSAFSSVHRGNDGIPFNVDNLTISFAKWRNESMKAYGNAIVPQVMYRIFQCIEETERSWK